MDGEVGAGEGGKSDPERRQRFRRRDGEGAAAAPSPQGRRRDVLPAVVGQETKLAGQEDPVAVQEVQLQVSEFVHLTRRVSIAVKPSAKPHGFPQSILVYQTFFVMTSSTLHRG